MNEEKDLKWDVDVSILTNRFILSELLRVLSISAGSVILILAIILGFDFMKYGSIATTSSNLSDFKYFMIIILLLFFLTTLFIFAYYGNKYCLTYILDDKGIRIITRKEQRKKNNIINMLLIILGAFASNATIVGTGLINRGSQNMQLKWKAVKKIKVVDGKSTIIINGGYGVKAIIFCTDEVYEAVKDFVYMKCSSVAS